MHGTATLLCTVAVIWARALYRVTRN